MDQTGRYHAIGSSKPNPRLSVELISSHKALYRTMSKGLGKMQRAILNALELAKRAHAEGDLDYRGGELSQ